MLRLYNYFFKSQEVNEDFNIYNYNLKPVLIETATNIKDIINIRDFSTYNDKELFDLYEKYKCNYQKHLHVSNQIRNLRHKLNSDVVEKDLEMYIRCFYNSSSEVITRAVYHRPGGIDFVRSLDIKLEKNIPLITF